MGRVYRQIVTRPLPAGAIVKGRGRRCSARWTDRRGRTRTARVVVHLEGLDAGKPIVGKDGKMRIACQAKTWMAEYRNGEGRPDTVATGCRDKGAALARLAELERRAELVRAGVMSVADDQISRHARTPIARHIDAFLSHMASKGDGDQHQATTRAYLELLADVCCWRRLGDLRREPLEQWLAAEAGKDRSARSRNAHMTAIISFGNWCVATRRLAINPFARMPKLSEKADRRRQRRALFAEELLKLLVVARLRPLAELGREPQELAGQPAGQGGAIKPRRQPWQWSTLTLETIAEAAGRAREKLDKYPRRLAALEDQGFERALVYKALVLTGLRKGELASLTVGQVSLDLAVPFLELEAVDEKNRQGSLIPIPPDLAGDLRTWLTRKLQRAQERARLVGDPIPMRLAGDDRLFDVPAGLLRILDRDLVAAGLARRVKDPISGEWTIDKRDERGRSIDVHALRTTFGTLLSQAGVPLRTAQEAMRHSDPRLTANVYTDPKLLDVAGAVGLLPNLPIGTEPPGSVTGNVTAATGTSGHEVSQPVKTGSFGSAASAGVEGVVSAPGSTSKHNITLPVTTCPDAQSNRGDRIRTCDLLTPSQEAQPPTSLQKQPLTAEENNSYLECYRSSCHNDADAVSGLASEVLALSPEQRRRLLAILADGHGQQPHVDGPGPPASV